MLALRFAAVLALVFWIGGLAALGALAAPAAFDVLGALGQDGRALAGAVFGETLKRFHRVAYICGAVIATSLLVRAVLGPRPRRFAVRLSICAVMIAAVTWSGLVLIPQIEAARAATGSAPSTLAGDDPGRAEFDRLHGLSRSVQLVPLLGGLVLLLFELKDR